MQNWLGMLKINLFLLVVLIAPPALCGDVLVYHNNGNNDGQNLTETILTSAVVSGAGFGKLWTTPLDGPVAGQVLYKAGTPNAAFVATTNDTLCAVNGDTGAIIWQKSLLHSFHGGTPAPRDVKHSVTDTPVIDPTTGAIYVEVYELENGNSIHVLESFNIVDGSQYANPVLIAEGTSSSVYVSGPAVANGKKFDSKDLMSRLVTIDPVRHTIYIGYGDYFDVGPYNGWILGYSAVKDGANNLVSKAVWCDTPNGSRGGIWAGGGGIAIDTNGNLFLVTGNGTFDTALATVPYSGRLSTNVPSLQAPGRGDYGDSVIKLSPDSDIAQQPDNPNGWGLHVADYFTPKNEQTISNGDVDLGSTGAVLLPDSVGSPAHQQLLVVDGKQGTIFLIDRNNMSGYHGDANGTGGGTNNMVQELDGATTEMEGTAAFFAGTVYFAANGDFAKTFSISNAVLARAGTGTIRYSSGATPEISANGASNGILWTVDRGSNSLIANDATSLAQLFRGTLTGSMQAFYTPTVANGKVYVATSSGLIAYGCASCASGQLPDLISTAVAYNTMTHKFSSTVKNQGPVSTPLGKTIGVAYLVDGVKCSWGYVSGSNTSLAPGASVAIANQGPLCTIPSGMHTITAFSDDVNRIVESDETNNNLSQPITIP